ncbi:hypothetical protein HNQ50_001462 [Silvimonas terrae]|uniref:Phenol degradation protein meta n=1 Tax=Silvimonas terrae TaxID=300266 RepID=A0A840RED6_9NEIS|nr:transporter [Silvimonas terrae]MBB5190740.1 hypothetical protein [Silvimonas terrae]
MRSCFFPCSMLAGLLALALPAAHATEGALGRPITGTAVSPDIGIVPPEPVWIVNVGEIYLDGTVSDDRLVPIAGKESAGISGEISFTQATLMKVWDTGAGRWNFASSFTLPYVWTQVDGTVGLGPLRAATSQQASNLFDIYFAPIIAGYHISKTEHVAFSFNVWAPTGQYDPTKLANPSLNNWTFVPQVAYTHIFPEQGMEFDAVSTLQFYTPNKDTDYHNAPQFTLDLMGLKHFSNKLGVGLVMGTTQQLGDDSGPTAAKLNGFKGHDYAIGPIVTYDATLDTKHTLSLGLRWVPTVSSKNRLDSQHTFMGTALMAF